MTNTGEGYRFGFNGKENDTESFSGCIAFEARIYDSRIARFLTSDPWESKYAWQSPFAYFKNSPIGQIDFLGMGDDKERVSNPNNPRAKKKTVVYGDNVWNISKSELGPGATDAQILNLTNSIISVNGLNDNGDIKIGQKLIIPQTIINKSTERANEMVVSNSLDNSDESNAINQGTGNILTGIAKGVAEGAAESIVTMNPILNTIQLVGNLVEPSFDLVPRMTVTSQEQVGYFAGIIIFAIAEPGPGGEARLLKKSITHYDDLFAVAGKIANKKTDIAGNLMQGSRDAVFAEITKNGIQKGGAIILEDGTKISKHMGTKLPNRYPTITITKPGGKDTKFRFTEI